VKDVIKKARFKTKATDYPMYVHSYSCTMCAREVRYLRVVITAAVTCYDEVEGCLWAQYSSTKCTVVPFLLETLALTY